MTEFEIKIVKSVMETHKTDAGSHAEALEHFNASASWVAGDPDTNIHSIEITNRETGEAMEMHPDFAEVEPVEAPAKIRYGVRFWGTFRACGEVEIEAASYADLISQVNSYDLDMVDFTRRDEDFTLEGDVTASVYRPMMEDDDNVDSTPSDDSSPWDINCDEIDKRAPGEVFTWDAEKFVKRMANFRTEEEAMTSTCAETISEAVDLEEEYQAFQKMIKQARSMMRGGE